MAQLILTVPDQYVDRIRAAFGAKIFYESPVGAPGSPQPATVAQLQEQLLKFIRIETLKYEREEAARAASGAVVEIPL